jgi:hypothetical protein
VTVRLAALRPGRHSLTVVAADWQETKNSENASPVARPNTRFLRTTFRLG